MQDIFETTEQLREKLLSVLSRLVSCGFLPRVPLPYFAVEKTENGFLSDVAVKCGEICDKQICMIAQIICDELCDEFLQIDTPYIDENGNILIRYSK